MQISYDVKKECIRLTEQGLSSRQVYMQYYSKQSDVSYQGFRSMLVKWKRKALADDKLLEVANLSYNFKAHAATVQINSEGEIVQSWIKSNASDNLYMELIDEVKRNTPPIKIDCNKSLDSENMLEIPLFDMHLGVANLKHYKDTMQEILGLVSKQVYKEINIIVGQDMIHNDNFNGTTTKGTVIERINVVAAWNDAKIFWYNIIDKAITQANKVNVIYSKGNHDKTVTWAFMQMLKERYGDIVEDSLLERKAITYGNNFIGITHGEFKKNKASDLRSQFSVRFPMEFAHSKVKEIHTGHLHHEQGKDDYGVMCRRLSTGGKEDEWSDSEGYIGAIKRFMIFEWTTDKLKAIYYV